MVISIVVKRGSNQMTSYLILKLSIIFAHLWLYPTDSISSVSEKDEKVTQRVLEKRQ